MPRYLSVLLLAVLDRWACPRGGGGATTVEAFALLSPTTPTSTRRRFAEHVGTTASKPPVGRRLDRGTATATALGAKKKGFAKQAKPPPGARKPDALEEPVAAAADASAAAPTRTTAAPEPREVEPDNNNEGSPASAEALNPGQRALAKLRREREEQRDRELRKVRDLLAADAQVQGAPAAIPERVAQRMGRRMLPFVGAPLLGSAATFVGFWYLRSYQNLEVQPSLVASASVFFLVVGLLVSKLTRWRAAPRSPGASLISPPILLFWRCALAILLRFRASRTRS
jgi:hypothetical protein